MTAEYITVLVIEHKHGVNASAHRTPDGAEAERIHWAETWWDDEIPDDVEKPEDPSDMADVYFDVMSGTETYWVETVVLRD